MQPQETVHRTVLVVDVEAFGDLRRTNPHQSAVRDALYRILRQAFDESGIGWDDCHHEDRGDGVLVVAPAEFPKALFTEALPPALVTLLAEHNSTHPDEQRIRLRMAVHAGELRFDGHGVVGAAVNHTFRLLEARQLKAALTGSPGVLAIIASSWFFDDVVRHSPASGPDTYRAVRVSTKETRTTGWIRLPDHVYRPRDRRLVIVGAAIAAVCVISFAAVKLLSPDSATGQPGSSAPTPAPTSVSTSEQTSVPATTSTTTAPAPTATAPSRPLDPTGRPTGSAPPPPPPTTTVGAETATVHVQRDVTLDRYSAIDVDSGAYNPTYGGDLYYGQDANTLEFFFQPMADSEIWPVGGTGQDIDRCTAARSPQEKIVLTSVPVVVCLKTTDGRISAVKVIRSVEGPSGRSYDVNYLTWERTT
ncbi:hypothetical protein FKR81_07540 [Lentzea tibetensis]|uniref:Guanylate cyclase domain-containing protein n=1 Tax=Lentzea tibetensis TaxID=2591470 RepID=A0A563EZ02_9PSEU|nr:hypothetical protein [Lentzea tibetensis]TWP52950.1 hypothetical protein FKR81_07540 [Lentzea tibetensis]